MSFDPNAGVKQFGEWTFPLLHAFPTIDLRYLAFRLDERVCLLYGKAVLRPTPFNRIAHSEVISHPDFRVVRWTLPSATLRDILERLPSGLLEFEDEQLTLAIPDRNPSGDLIIQPLTWHASRGFADPMFWDGRSPSGEAIPRFTLSTHGKDAPAIVPREKWSELESALLGARPRWLGFADLFNRFFGAEYQWTMNHNTELTFDIPLGCQLGGVRLDNRGRLQVGTIAPRALKRGALRVAALLSDVQDRRWISEVSVSRLEPLGTDGLGSGQAVVSLGSANSVVLHLLLHDTIVAKAAYDLWARKSPNPRLAAMSTLGTALPKVDELLNSSMIPVKEAERFENVVATLFAAAGFVSFHSGYKRANSGEAVDVLAMHPFIPLAFAIECTVGRPSNKDKIAKLGSRTTDLRRRLSDWTVRGLLVVAGDEISTVDRAEADARGVQILTMPALRALRQKISWDSDPTAMARYILGVRRLGDLAQHR